MKKAVFSIAFFLFFSSGICAQVMWQFSQDTVVKWYYQEGDEFNGSSVNTGYWKYWLWSHSLYMNWEQQYYTAGSNHQVSNGTLKLIAKREPGLRKTLDYKGDNDSLFAGKKFISLNRTNYEFTSGKLATQKTYNKGYFECRFKMPASPGYWPAFWLHGGDPNEEIDIMEAESKRPNDIHVDTHCPNHCDMIWRGVARESFGAWIKTRLEFVNGFNVVACEWADDYVKYYLNGEFIAISKVKFDVPKHLTLNLAVPSEKGPFGPGPAANDSSGVFEVDYVRVWSKEQKQDLVPEIGTVNNALPLNKELVNESILKNRGKSFYGNKKLGENEGLKVSVFFEKNLLYLSVLGNVKNDVPKFQITATDRNFVFEADLHNSFNEYDLSAFKKGKYLLNFTWNNKIASHTIAVE